MTPAERVRVHATAWAILKDPHAADDVAQELALRLEKNSDDVEPGVRGSWIARQAVGMSMNRRRGERRRARNERDAGLFRAARRSEASDAPLEQAEDMEQVRTALAGLEERQRLPLILRYFHDRRLAEIASILEVPVSTAHERLQRGLSTMRGMMRRVDVTPALIGLALPRAAVVVAPTAVVGRLSVLAGGAYWLSRAAVLLAVASLSPEVPGAGPNPEADLMLCAVEPQAEPPRFPEPPPVQPPAVPEVHELEAPVPPVAPPPAGEPVGEGRPDAGEEPAAPETWRAEEPAHGDLVSGAQGPRILPWRSAREGRTSERGATPGGAHPSSGESRGRDSGDGGYDTGHSSSRGTGEDDSGSLDSGSGPSGNGDEGDGGSDGGSDDGEPGENGPDVPDTGESNGGGLFGGSLPGRVTTRDGAPTGDLWVIALPVSRDEGAAAGGTGPSGPSQPIASAQTDDLGRFRLHLPEGAGELTVQVAVQDEEGEFALLPLVEAAEGVWEREGALRLEVE